MQKKFAILFIICYNFFSNSFAQTAEICKDFNDLKVLDFWIGSWEVYEDSTKVGINRIEKILDECAIIENWEDIEGNSGKSLFYFFSDTLRQVWVTEWALRIGGTKEKKLIKKLNDGGVIFQGNLQINSSEILLDRTTLRPLENGDVLQQIELSKDKGKTWTTWFKGLYKRKNN